MRLKIGDRSDVNVFTCSFNSMTARLNSNWDRDFPDFEIKIEVLFKAEVYKSLDEHPSHLAIKRLKKLLGSAAIKHLIAQHSMGFETVEEAKAYRNKYGDPMDVELQWNKAQRKPNLDNTD